MEGRTEFLRNVRSVIKLHESMLKEICGAFGLSLLEANIISFLYNNPRMDTAGDIVEFRGLSKGNVSRAVEELIRKGLLARRQDTGDRRKIHLSLLPGTKPITEAIKEGAEEFQREIFRGISEEEQQFFAEINRRMMENTKQAMKRRGLR